MKRILICAGMCLLARAALADVTEVFVDKYPWTDPASHCEYRKYVVTDPEKADGKAGTAAIEQFRFLRLGRMDNTDHLNWLVQEVPEESDDKKQTLVVGKCPQS